MDSIRKWFYKPKKDDTSLLAQFFYADESLNGVACELDSFDGRQEPERCTSLVNQLRHCQDKVLTICNQIMDELIPDCRANRDFRVKFPDDVMQENLAGQLWFGAECLAAGSSILNREAESSAMRPLAKALTKSLEIVRNLLREHALKGHMDLKAQNALDPSTEKLIESLKIFDRLFADFELCYVGAMVPVKSTKEYEQQELVCVLFSETLHRALERGLLKQADVDNYEPALMFTIPRLAIVAGLLAPPGGPLCLKSVDSISEMFRPFRTLLLKIRELLWTLNSRELYMLEKLLCSIEEPSTSITQDSNSACQEIPDLEEFVNNFYTGYPNCKDFIADFYTITKNNGNNMDEVANDALLIMDQENRLEICNNAIKVSRRDARTSNIRDNTENFPSQNFEFPSTEGQINQNLVNPDISHILGNSEEIEIPQSQYLLNQVSHEQAETTNSVDIQSSLPDVDCKQLITEANRTLSNLLLDENSEHTDSGICTVISSENTSLYDKSPEEKKTFTETSEKKVQDEEQENTSYSCSNLNSPKRRHSTNSDNGCVCNTKVTRNPMTSRKSSIDSTHISQGSGDTSKSTPRISSNFEHSSDEIVGITYGNGQIPVCSGNHPTLQINYSENWENLNLNIDSTNSHKNEFWSDLKCENCPSTSTNFDKVGKKIEKLAQERMTIKNKMEEKLKRKHRRNYEKYNGEYCMESKKRSSTRNKLHLPTSTESSRSNSTDRCLNPRLVNFGASLHPSQNTRQMPYFGAHNSHNNPRIEHFDYAGHSSSPQRIHVAHHSAQNATLQNRKLLDSRRSRSEHMQRIKKRDHTAKKDKLYHKNDHIRKAHLKNKHELINDGFGPRTNKSGIVYPVHDGSTNHSHVGTSHYVAYHDSTTVNSKMHVSKILINARSDLVSSSDSSSETSEFHSDCQDDEEIALAMQAAEIANRNQIRAKFRSSEDLVHRLFVCIAGVADQLQTNFASDLRNILKCVFLMNSSQPSIEDIKETEPTNEVDEPTSTNMSEQQNSLVEDETEERELSEDRNSPVTERGEECVEKAPVWIPDIDAPRCMACHAGFTVVRRRHHCRNCGKVFCGRCSSNNVPLPRFGHNKPVRVCNRCFLYQVTPFTVSQVTPSR